MIYSLKGPRPIPGLIDRLVMVVECVVVWCGGVVWSKSHVDNVFIGGDMHDSGLGFEGVKVGVILRRRVESAVEVLCGQKWC